MKSELREISLKNKISQILFSRPKAFLLFICNTYKAIYIKHKKRLMHINKSKHGVSYKSLHKPGMCAIYIKLVIYNNTAAASNNINLLSGPLIYNK